jgi:stalled ribosome alternative rescue factor ArfA
MSYTTKKAKRQGVIEHNDMKKYLDDNKGWRTQVQIDSKARGKYNRKARNASAALAIAAGAGVI